MKRILLFIIAALLFSTAVTERVNAQEGVKFDKKIYDFGDLKESDGAQVCTFTFQNIGKDPVVVQTVVSSCGCTSPEWTKKPIKTGEKGEIVVKFLNNQGALPFDKSLTVYITGEKKPIILRLKGVVHKKPKKLTELFPVKVGELGFRHLPVSIGYVAQGESKSDIISVANISKKKINVEFRNQTPGLSISISPTSIEPEGKAEISYTINTNIAPKRWGINSYSADVMINGRLVSTQIKPAIEACIRYNFANLTKEQIDKASLPIADENSYDFGEIKRGSSITKSFVIKNIGRDVLRIYKIDSSVKGVSFSKYESEIKPGMSATIKVSVDTAEMRGETTIIVSMITNSPLRPIFNLFMSGIVK